MAAKTEHDKALDAVRRAARKADDLAESHRDAVAARNAAVYDAKHHHGCTYAELASAMGVTRDRVSQVLGEQRRARSTTT